MRDTSRAPWSHLLALGLVSAGLLQFEIALTKVFSIVLWYHFGFLVISVALLGFAMAGVWLSDKADRLEEGGAFLARLCGGASLATALALWLVTHTQVDAQYMIKNHNEGGVVLQLGVLLPAFFLLGAAISATLTMHRARAGGVYAANLVGSGLGCASAILLFDQLHWSAPDACLTSALMVAVGGVIFALQSGGRGLVSTALPAALLGYALFGWEGKDEALHLRAPASKPLWHGEEWDRQNNPEEVALTDGSVLRFHGGYQFDPATNTVSTTRPSGEPVTIPFDDVVKAEDGLAEVRPSSIVEFTEWTSLSRVDAFHWPAPQPWGTWGLSNAWTGGFPPQKAITIDSWAMTNVMGWEGGKTGEAGEPPEILEFLPASLCHRVRPNAEILCIGAGGGMDLLTAIRFGAESITGVEINPGVVRAARDVFGEFQGHLYEPGKNPNAEHVNIHVAEGRHFLERDESRYDIVQLSGVDTASTTQAGAFSLSENFLYTAEAFDTYLEHTKDDGIVTLTRWVLPDIEEGRLRNTLRLFVLAWGALERAGVPDPGQCIYLVSSEGFSVILFGRQPFTPDELARLDQTCLEKNFEPYYHPARPSPFRHFYTGAPLAENPYELFAQADDKNAWLAAYPYDVAAPTDDRPFFFETSRFRHLFTRDAFFSPLGGITAHGILVILLGLLALCAWWFVLRPLKSGAGVAGGLPSVFYFGGLGLGFILVEVVLAQRFILYLGNPLYSLSVVLFSVLLFSGLGSALSSKLSDPRLPLAGVILLAIAYPLLCTPLFEATLHLDTWMRIAIAVGLLAPLAICMGMPFPLGVRRVSDARAVAWAWGINGYTSVLGSVLTVVLSISVGFDRVVWTGAGVYLIALIAAGMLPRGETNAEAAA